MADNKTKDADGNGFNDPVVHGFAQDTASNLSAILTQTTKAVLEKEQRHYSWMIHSGMIILACGLLGVYLLLWMHMSEPGHREGYAGMRANEKRLENCEKELSKMNRVLEKAEYTEENVKLIRTELVEIKAELVANKTKLQHVQGTE